MDPGLRRDDEADASQAAAGLMLHCGNFPVIDQSYCSGFITPITPNLAPFPTGNGVLFRSGALKEDACVLEGKVALVTGAASGIGKRIAEGLRRERRGRRDRRSQPRRRECGRERARSQRRGKRSASKWTSRTSRTSMTASPPSSNSSATSTFWCRTRASRSSIRSKNSRTPTGRSSWRSMSTARSSRRAPAFAQCTRAARVARSSTWARCIPRKHRSSRRHTSPRNMR